MKVPPFDSLRLATRLRETAGFSHEHAEAAAESLAEAIGGSELATKADLAALKIDLTAESSSVRSEVAMLRQDMTAAIEIAKRDLKIWMGTVFLGGMSVFASILLAAIRYMPRG